MLSLECWLWDWESQFNRPGASCHGGCSSREVGRCQGEKNRGNCLGRPAPLSPLALVNWSCYLLGSEEQQRRRDIFVLDLWLLFQERVPLCPSEFLMLHFCPFIEIYSSPLTAAPSHPVNCFLINEAVFSSSDPWTHVLRSQDWLQHRHRFIHLVFKSHLVCLFSLIRRIELVILLLSRAPVWNLRKLSP